MPHSIGSKLFKTWLTTFVHLTVFCSSYVATQRVQNYTVQTYFGIKLFWNLEAVFAQCFLFCFDCLFLFLFVVIFFFGGGGEFARLIWLDKSFPSCTFASVRLGTKPFMWNCVRLEVSNWLSYERFCLRTRFKTETEGNSKLAYWK